MAPRPNAGSRVSCIPGTLSRKDQKILKAVSSQIQLVIIALFVMVATFLLADLKR
jgi:hypothetical protein